MKMHRFFTAVVCLAAILLPSAAQGFSITSVTLSPGINVPPGTALQMTVDITTPGQPPFLYAPSQVNSNSTGIHIDIFPSSGALAAIGQLREPVTLGTFPSGTYNYEVVLRPDPNYGPVNWGVRTNRGSFTVGSESAAIFSTDFNSGLPPGTRVFGSAVVESGVLKLTSTMNAQQGSFIIDKTLPITAFTATFRLLIGGGNGADGLSFNFAHDLPDDIFGEEGAGTGLTVSFDTFDNGGGEAPAIDAKMGGVVIASVPGSGVFRTGDFEDVRIHVDSDGTLDVSVNNTTIFQNLPIGFSARSGRFGFGARTGGLNDNHFIDDVKIISGQPSHPAVTSAAPRGSAVRPDAAVNITIEDFGTQVNPASIQLTFNGSAVTPQISKSGDMTTVQYDPPGLLPVGSTNSVSLTYSDNGNPVFTDTFSYGFKVADNVGPNENFYEVVLVSTPITWPEAKAAAEQRTYAGVRGHLATITSAEEDMFLERLRQENRPTVGQNQLWVGGSQTVLNSPPTENWFWENDEGPIASANGGATYANWHAGEPNDYWGPATENYLAIGLFDAFGWNDDGFLDGGRLGGYIVEYELGQSGRRLTLEDPRDGQEFVPGETVYLRASLNDTSEGPWRIEFFSGDQRIGESTNRQTIFWLDAWAGQHVIRARATNPQGTVVSSGSATIHVGAGPAILPVVSIEATEWRTAEPCPTCLVVPGLLTIRRSAPTNTALTVFLDVDGTATRGLDYEVLPSSVTIPAGQRSVQLNLLPKDDQLVEGPEVVRVRIASSSTYMRHCCSDEALIVIRDDEAAAPTARLDIILPTNGARFPAGRTIELSAMAVNLDNEVYNSEFYADGQLIARAHGDATTRPAIPGLPSVHTGFWTNPPAGQHTLTARAELSFNNWVTSPPVNITIESSPFPVVRLETVPLQNARAIEFCPPNADCAYPSFVVRRSGPTNAELRVYLSYSGTATRGADYPELQSSVVIPAGRDSAFVMLVPNDDSLAEGPETVVARFTPIPAPTYFEDPSASSATITIIDNDSPAETVVSIRAEDSIATELPPIVAAIDPARFRISRTGDLSRELLVFFSVAGSATAGPDYQELTSPIRIPAGAQSTTLDVRAIYDEIREGLETVVVRLEPSPSLSPLPTYAIDPANPSATAFIRDSGVSEARLTITKPTNSASFNPGETILIEAIAVDPDRYINRVEFWDGETRIGVSEIVFVVPPDPGTPILHSFEWRAAFHGPHLLTARATRANGGSLRSAPVSITVGGDPPPPFVRIDATSRIAEETSEPFRRTPLAGVFTISRTGPTNQAASVFVNYSGTATRGVDYAEQPWIITIPAGASSADIRIEAVPDNIREGIETVIATLSDCPPNTDPPLGMPCVGTAIDPAHKGATVFIREDGITDATLTITRPTNGASFTTGQTIAIEAVAIDLDSYISRVEFWDGENRIGVSEIVFVTPPAPGTPIHHRFEWRNAPAGPHVLTARASRSNGSAVTSQPVNITVQGEPPPADRELHVVGAYSGTAPGGGTSHTNEQGDAAITVNRPGKHVTLVLSAYEPVVWHLNVGNTTLVDRIILGGYYRQRVEGVGSNVEIIDATFPNRPENYLYVGYSLDCPDVYRGLAKIRAMTGLEISAFHGGYQAPYPSPIVIDSVQDDPRLRANYPVPTPASQLPNLEFQLSFYQRGGGGDVFTRQYTLAGPRDDTRLLPATRVFRDGGTRYYYGLEWHEPFRVDTQTDTEQDFRPPASLPELSWPWGFTYDPQRNRVLLVSFGGEGYLYGYMPNTEQWSLVRSMDNIDVESLEYHAADNSLYALTVFGGDCGSPRVKKFTPDGQFVSEFPLALQGYGLSLGRHTTELVSVGEYLVLLLEPMHFSNYEDSESRMYLIDPRTGQSWLTYRSSGNPANQSPNIAIIKPSNGAELPSNTPVEITVETRDPDGYARTVEFFADGRKIGEQSVTFVLPPPPGQPQTFTFTWREATVGSHVLTTRAIDDDNASTISAPVYIRVGSSNLLPTVTVVATDCFAVEPLSNNPVNTGAFRISRSGATSESLLVYLSLLGAAQGGVDYENISGSVVIPPGQQSVTLTVRPLADNLIEGIETAILQLEEPPPISIPEIRPPQYRLGSPRRAFVLISDADVVLAANTTRLTRLADGALHFCFATSTQDNFQVEATSDFRNWEPVGTAAPEGGVLHFVEPDMAAHPYRFYRIVSQSLAPVP